MKISTATKPIRVALVAFLEQCERPVVPMTNDPGRVNVEGIVVSCRGHHGRFFTAIQDPSVG